MESRNMEKGPEKDRQVAGTIRREVSEMAEVLVRVDEMMEKMEKMAEEITWLKRSVKEGFRKNKEEMCRVRDVLEDWEKVELEDANERAEVEAE
jgi:division protein CdvB (Snf7/Vps24/ESCRT-III family)